MSAASRPIRRARRSAEGRLRRFVLARFRVRPAEARRAQGIVVVPRPARGFRLLFGLRAVRTIEREELTSPPHGHMLGWIDEVAEPALAADAARAVIVPPPESGRRIPRGTPPARPRRDYLAEVRSARLLGRSPLAITPRGEVIVEATTWTREDNARIEFALASLIRSRGLRRTLREIRQGPDRSALPTFECGCLLTGGQNRFNYYHWTFEQIPKLRALEEYRRRTGRAPALIVPPDPPEWSIEMLRLAGHGDAELIEWRDRDARIKRLVVPAYPAPSPAVCAWLRERLRDPLLASGPAELVDQPRGGERILISRDDSAKAKRRVVNERELEERLGELGFRSYALGELSVAEQITLFAGAEAVVAPHGAGLTNLVYARRAAVVELFGRRLKPIFYQLARLLGHPYHYVLCEPAGGRDGLRANAEEVAQVASELIRRLDSAARIDR